MNELPKGWAASRLPDVAYFQEGPGIRKFQYRESGIPFLNIRTLVNERVDLSLCKYLDESEVQTKYPHFLLNEGDLVCSTSGTLGKIAAITADDLPLMLNTSVVRFRSLDEELLRQRFLRHFLKSEAFLSQAKAASTGSAQVNIGPSHLATFELPLPPLLEQKRIADKLDTVLARVDACRDRLDRIPTLLKRFRQSILAAATSGRLTDDWRATRSPDEAQRNPGATVPTATDTNALWQIPDSWQWKAAEHACHFITKGTTPKKESMTAASGDVPYIKVYNLTFDGSLDFSINPTFVDRTTHESDLKRSQVLPGDVLMNIVGPPLGKVSIVPPTYPEWNINQAIARFRPAAIIQSSYLGLCLRSSELLEHASRQAKATAGQFNLTLEICRALPIPVPPLEEQYEIVRRVEILFAFADRLEARLATARKQVGQLTPALLAKAFRGELVPQDPNDEPAVELLKRLAAQREAAPKATRGRKTTVV